MSTDAYSAKEHRQHLEYQRLQAVCRTNSAGGRGIAVRAIGSDQQGQHERNAILAHKTWPNARRSWPMPSRSYRHRSAHCFGSSTGAGVDDGQPNADRDFDVAENGLGEGNVPDQGRVDIVMKEFGIEDTVAALALAARPVRQPEDSLDVVFQCFDRLSPAARKHCAGVNHHDPVRECNDDSPPRTIRPNPAAVPA